MKDNLKLVSRNAPDELKFLSDDLRKLADEIENGEVIAFAWAAIRVEDKFETDFVKARGVSKVTVAGAVGTLLHSINDELLS